MYTHQHSCGNSIHAGSSHQLRSLRRHSALAFPAADHLAKPAVPGPIQPYIVIKVASDVSAVNNLGSRILYAKMTSLSITTTLQRKQGFEEHIVFEDCQINC